jgi:hypothetical protein
MFTQVSFFTEYKHMQSQYISPRQHYGHVALTDSVDKLP